MRTPPSIAVAIYEGHRRRLALDHHRGSPILFGIARWHRSMATLYRKAARKNNDTTLTVVANEHAELCRMLNKEYWKGLKAENEIRDLNRPAAVPTWEVEYEIPPLRAIYHAEVNAASEKEVRDRITRATPHCQIRKITRITS